MKYGRYDDAIKYHQETVNCLTKAITESTIPENVEHLELQRKHHENIQQIIARQKNEFADFLLKNGLKIISKPDSKQIDSTKKNSQSYGEHFPNEQEKDAIFDNFTDAREDNEFFSLIGELKIDQNNSDDNVMHAVEKDNTYEEEYFSLR